MLVSQVPPLAQSVDSRALPSSLSSCLKNVRFRDRPGPIPFPRVMVPFHVPKAVPESKYRNPTPLGEFRDVHPSA